MQKQHHASSATSMKFQAMHKMHMRSSTIHPVDLAAALRQFADTEEMSQRDLAELGGVDQSTISRVMTGNYGRDGWKAAMTILGLGSVIRSLDGSYSTPDLPELIDLLSEEMAKELQASSPDRVVEIRDLQERVTELQARSR